MTKVFIAAFFAVATVLDYISTVLCLELRVSYEGNPIAAFVLDNFGYGGFLVAKILAIVIFCLLISLSQRFITLMIAYGVGVITFTVSLLNFSLLI